MSNIITCLLFNVVGLGSSYFLSLLSSEKNISEKPGTFIFWGFWASLLFTFALWLFIPDRLDVVCYITLAISLIGVGLLLKREGGKSLLKSEYLIALLFLTPFIFIVEYTPGGWDEFSHWLMTPKVFYHERTLTPSEISYGFYSYTPLWTLQAAFFQFFTSLDFNETIIYAVRINFFLAFIFFIKEITKLRFLTLILLTLGIIFLFHNYYLIWTSVLTIEFPIYILTTSTLFLVAHLKKNQLENTPDNLLFFLIAILSAYMIKKPLIAMLPAGIFILWLNGYKKQLFYFLTLFAVFYFSWKIKSDDLMGNLNFHLEIDPWGTKATTVYQQIIQHFFVLKGLFFSFLLSMLIIFWKNKNVFTFHLIFSLVYFFGLIFTYVFWFIEYESSILAGYDRYLASLFIPAFIFAFYIILSESQKFIDLEKHVLKYATKIKYLGAVLISGVVGGYFYHTSSTINNHYIMSYYEKTKNLYDKIKKVYDVKNKNCLAIWQGGNNLQKYLTGYIGYGELRKIEGGSFGPHKDNFWRTEVRNEEEFVDLLKKEYDILLVVESDDWLNRIFLKLANQKTDELKDFALVRKESNYEIIRLYQ